MTLKISSFGLNAGYKAAAVVLLLCGWGRHALAPVMA
jgi:hypothetical protein